MAVLTVLRVRERKAKEVLTAASVTIIMTTGGDKCLEGCTVLLCPRC